VSHEGSRRRWLFVGITALVAVALVEVGTRAVFSVVAGRSLLGYGLGSLEPEQKPGMLFPHFDRADWHRVLAADDREKVFLEHESGPYSRYQPHQFKRNRDEYGHISEIRINNLGVRGPDVAATKPRGVFRVITLGASSTFGYRNRDDETYPRWVEKRLIEGLSQGRCAGVERFEVVNFGIPHLNAAHIRAFFLAEGLDLDPDLVTFYEGANETRLVQASFAQRTLSALGQRSLAIRYVQTALQGVLASFSKDELAEQLEGRSEAFLAEIAAIAQACAARGVDFAAVTQSAKSFRVEADAIAAVSYADERALVEAALARDGSIPLKEMIFLMHAELMDALRDFARREGVALVDVIGAMDDAHARDELLSWVHLSSTGNRLVARVLADAIFERACEAVPSETR
jgi:lysophospholipase L1-like esterase